MIENVQIRAIKLVDGFYGIDYRKTEETGPTDTSIQKSERRHD